MSISISAEIEGGYGHDAQSIIGNVSRTTDTGVAGINIEDAFKHQPGLRNVKEHCQLLANIRATLDNHGYKNFFINARTDTYFQLEQPYEETLTRAKAYVESGASSIFIPGLTDAYEIKGITRYGIYPSNKLSTVKSIRCKHFGFGHALSDKIIAHLTKNAAQLLESRATFCLYE